ncbi:MAG: oligosaccharide flippase family protein, partial [Candidatus Tectomicrobia bacterium]|nr:oligosaccharide flippase family protein [Candidatus Tectomicrobia bacterium]
HEDTAQRSLFIGATSILFASALCAAAGFAYGGNRVIAKWFNNPGLEHTLQWVAPFLLAQMMVPAAVNALVATKRSMLAAGLTLTLRLSTAFAAVIGALWTASYIGPVFCIFALSGIIAVLASLYVARLFSPTSESPQRTVGVPELFRVGVPLSLASASGLLHRQLDKLVVSSIVSPVEYATYAVAARELPLVDILASSSSTVAIPELSRLLDAGRTSEVLRIWHRMCRGIAALLIPSFVYLFTVSESFIHTLYTTEYAEALLPFRLYLCVLPARVAIYNTLFVASGKSHLTFIRMIIALGLNLILTLVLTSWIGYVGATVATVAVVYCFSTPFSIFHIARILDVRLKEALPYGPIAVEGFKALLIPVMVIPLFLLPMAEEFVFLLTMIPFSVFMVLNNRDLAQRIRNKLRGRKYVRKAE